MKNQNKSILLFNSLLFPGVEAISGQYIGNDFRRHIHKTYIIGIVEKGIRVITSSAGATQISENEIFIINPGQVHSCACESQSGVSYNILSVSPQTLQSIVSQISEKPSRTPWFNKIRHRDGALSKKFMDLFKIIKNPESKIQMESSTYSFLARLLISFSESTPLTYKLGEQKESIERVCYHIRQNFTEDLSLSQLAAIACLSKFHFQREFIKKIGITPHEYLCDCRIGESKRMLLKSENIADIAVQLGFYDQSHFSRIFKKSVGVPPGRFSKTNRQNQAIDKK